MAREDNLIPIRSKERARELGKIGGLSNKDNPKTRLGARLRELRKKGLSDETAKRLYEIMTDPEVSALDIKLFLEKIRGDDLSPTQMIHLANVMVLWHKSLHGEKIKVDQRILNIDLVLDEAKTDEVIKRLLEKNEE